MAILKLPYTNLHELNLDWIIEQLNKEGAVLSINDKHGIVVLTGEDIARSASDPETIAHALTSQGTSIQTARNQIGTTPLPTTAQTITGAIAEHETDISGIDNKIGSSVLPTIAQTLTGAIAENAVEIANQEDLIGSTALPTTAQTITGAIAEHESDITGINTKIGTTALPTTAQTLTGAIAENDTNIDTINTNLTGLNTPEDKQIINTDTYFTERSAFKARRVGYTVGIFSYVNITTEVPSGTEFANIQFPSAEGYFLFVAGTTIKVVQCSQGKLKPDGALPTGYYYAIGTALAPV